MWRAEADPRMRSTVLGVEILDPTPDWDRFVAAHDWASRLVPRFRERVVDAARSGSGRRTGSRTATSTCTTTCAACGCPTTRAWPSCSTLAEQVAMTPFDRARPPWEAMLVEGLPDGGAGATC